MKVSDRTIFKTDALSLLERLDDAQFTLAYVDPPWATATNSEINLQEYRHFISCVVQQCRRLLNDSGTLYFHAPPISQVDYRLIINQVFSGQPSSVIVWRQQAAVNMSKSGPHNHEEILRYTKTSNAILNPIFQPPEKHSYNHTDKKGLYRLADLTVGVERPSLQYEWRGSAPPSGRSWRFPVEQMEQYDADGRISLMDGRVHLIKQYFGESLGKELQSVWEDIPPLRKNPTCPSAKPPELCSRIIRQSTDPGDWVLDPFCGSGQLLVQAQKLGRHWIGCDNEATSIAAAGALLEKKIGRTSYHIISAGQESFQDIPRIGTTYTDFYLKIEDLEDTRRKLARLADLTLTLKNELVGDKRDDEEIIAALQQMIPRLVLLISAEPKEFSATGLRKCLSDFDSLEEDAKDFLVTAKMILDILDDSFDFSVVSVSAWKAVELEISTKIFGAFRDWVLITYGAPVAFTESDYAVPEGTGKRKQDWEKKVLADFLRTNKVPAIGQLAAIISKCANSKKTVNESPAFSALIEFIGGQFQNPDYLLGKEGLCSLLTQKQIDLYRNGAAHTSKFDKARATASFEFVMKVLATFEAGLKRTVDKAH